MGNPLLGGTDPAETKRSELAIDYVSGEEIEKFVAFLRGEYDTAVFQAFKEVEVAVRKAGGFALTDIGVPLMRKAFDQQSGTLSDFSLPETERESLAHLFAGAVGLYKNPHSHRNQPISDPTEAVEMIVLASHLIRIVESRSAKP